MYIIDFLKRMTRKSNIPTLIYLVLNVLLIGRITQMLFCIGREEGMPYWQALLIGIALYLVSLTIALSPIGEWILRLQTGCRKIEREEQKKFIEPIFREVYEKAKELDSSISDNVQLFINEDKDPNAFATGRKTICVTEGLLQMPEDQIKATLGHEFGHLAHKDTDLILVITIGNFFVTTIVTIIKVFLIIINLIAALSRTEAITEFITSALTLLFVDAVMWVWTKIGTMLVMKSSRANEYEADEFSFRLGYGDSLCALLDSFTHSGAKGLFATLESSHPDKNDRIAKLQNLGANYRPSYGSEVVQKQSDAAQPAKTADANTKSQSVTADDDMQLRTLETDTSTQAWPIAAAQFTGSNMPKNVAFCAFCGTKLAEDDNFCPNCGSSVNR